MWNRKSCRLFNAFAGAVLAGIVAVATPAAALTAADDAAAFVDGLADQALGYLGDPGLNDTERAALFRDLFRDGFAVRGIAKFSLGRYWRSADDAQREEYLALFENVIVDTWSKRFGQYSGETFEVRGATPLTSSGDESVTIVQSLVWTSPDAPVRVDWRVASKGNIYKITDVTVEGVSMANTQRDEYASLVRQQGLDGLLERLRERSGEIDRLAAAQAGGLIVPSAGPDAAPADKQEPATVAATTLAVQVASLRSEKRARLAWEQLQDKFPETLGDRTVRLENVDLGDRGVFYRVRFGAFAAYGEAARICDELIGAGQDCLVVQR